MTVLTTALLVEKVILFNSDNQEPLHLKCQYPIYVNISKKGALQLFINSFSDSG